MTYFDSFILGLLQGLTEFLPVSSSGHLVITQALLGTKSTGVAFDVLLHLGSLLAVLIYFRSRILSIIQSLYKKEKETERKMILFLIVGTIPAVVAVLFFKDFFEQAFSNPLLASSMLFVTGLILLSTRFKRKETKSLSTKTSLLIGIGQSFAIIPGISRSGTTIATGMLAGIKPSVAAEFSFLLAIPAIIGAVVFKLDDLLHMDTSLMGQYGFGLVVTFLSSLFAVYAVLALIKKGKFEYFAYYCFAAGALGLYLFL